MMTRFNHLNVMKLLGVSVSQDKTLYLVMPFMDQGSLLSYLKKRRPDLTVENEEMTELVGNTVETLEYGHQWDSPLVRCPFFYRS